MPGPDSPHVLLESGAEIIAAGRLWATRSSLQPYNQIVLYRLAADLSVLVHLAFITFVIFGALLVGKHPRLRYLHWASLFYGLLVEVFNWYCPLTLLEQYLRTRLGRGAYERSFVVHYLDQLIYWDVPQWVLITGAVVVAALNIAFYWRTARASNPAS